MPKTPLLVAFLSACVMSAVLYQLLTNLGVMGVAASAVAGATWRRALDLARAYVLRLSEDDQLSPSFKPCVQALDEMQLGAAQKMARLD